MITQYELRKLLRFENGVFYWRESAKGVKRKDFRAGCIRNTGYEAIRINRRMYQSHVLAWLYEYGEFIPGEIDHINGVRNDNRISNLRRCNRSENSINRGKQSNNKSGVPGVGYRADTNSWYAFIGKGKVKKNGVVVSSGRTYLGCFKTKEEAVEARKSAEKIHFGEWARQ
ncbi:HNH endonuclease signature motif containing protein [Erwinia aphidicola]|uniref:HNH endonuclease signature motif containing protein n=1 Tax=Erwinia aphidicola TaxID=68334 RepID=UPI003016CFDB